MSTEELCARQAQNGPGCGRPHGHPPLQKRPRSLRATAQGDPLGPRGGEPPLGCRSERLRGRSGAWPRVADPAAVWTSRRDLRITHYSLRRRDLFTLHEDCPSHLHQKLTLEARGGAEVEAEAEAEAEVGSGDEGDGAAEAAAGGETREDKPQDGWPKETGDMHLWGHHYGCEGVNDTVLRTAGRRASPEEGAVSFVFSLEVQGKAMDEEASRPAAAAAVAATPSGAPSGSGGGGALRKPGQGLGLSRPNVGLHRRPLARSSSSFSCSSGGGSGGGGAAGAPLRGEKENAQPVAVAAAEEAEEEAEEEEAAEAEAEAEEEAEEEEEAKEEEEAEEEVEEEAEEEAEEGAEAEEEEEAEGKAEEEAEVSGEAADVMSAIAEAVAEEVEEEEEGEEEDEEEARVTLPARGKLSLGAKRKRIVPDE